MVFKYDGSAETSAHAWMTTSKKKIRFMPLALDVNKCIEVIKVPVKFHVRAWHSNLPSNKSALVAVQTKISEF